MLLRILVVLATAAITTRSDHLDISSIDGTADHQTHLKQKAIDRENSTYYHSKYGNSVKYIHVSLTEAAIVKQVIILNRSVKICIRIK